MLRNVVFDIGNVLVVWKPDLVVATIFPEANKDQMIQQIFNSKTWIDFESGKTSEEETLESFKKNLGIPLQKLQEMMDYVRSSQTPIDGTFRIVKSLHAARIPLFILSNNTKKTFEYLSQKYKFFNFFKGAAISADLNSLKPNPLCYARFLDTFHLIAEQCVMIDDLQTNIEGAKAMNMRGIQFVSPEQCINDLARLGLQF